MKRSDVNAIIERALEFCDERRFAVPPFARWSIEDWRAHRAECQEIFDNQIGWDITDFGSGDFATTGLLILVLRNGSFHKPQYRKPYCEKILIQDEGQELPTHFHWKKMEDIINRGGGNLMVSLNNALSDTEIDTKSPVTVTMDGQTRTVAAGKPIRVRPGESITLMPRQFHRFWTEPGTGRVLLGEVSTVADEEEDNNFIYHGDRIPGIEEDARPRYLLFADYRLLDDRNQW